MKRSNPAAHRHCTRLSRPVLVELAILAVCVLWSCWPLLQVMARRWSHDPRYSHGFLVPLFAVVLLWTRREQLLEVARQPSTWGLPLIGLGAGLQVAGGFIRLEWLEAVSLLPYLAGLVLLIGGWQVFRRSWQAVAFLIFMIPLPWKLEIGLGQSLQALATLASTYTLQTLGFIAFAEGNVICLNQAQINVAEACSGLSMLMTFVAMATAVALVVRLSILERVLLVLSAIPIALIANIARISLTGVLHALAGSEAADLFYHDLAGWLMILFALGLIWIETRLFSLVFVVPQEEEAGGTAADGRSPFAFNGLEQPRSFLTSRGGGASS